MTDQPEDKQTPPVELQEPVTPSRAHDEKEQWMRMSPEDLAALKYARHLKNYDEGYDEETGWGENSGATPMNDADDPHPEEHRIRRQVRKERRFWEHFAAYGVIIVFLLILNLLTSPRYLWVVWPFFGWGILVVLQALDVFGGGRIYGEGWERRQLEQRLERVSARRDHE